MKHYLYKLSFNKRFFSLATILNSWLRLALRCLFQLLCLRFVRDDVWLLIGILSDLLSNETKRTLVYRQIPTEKSKSDSIASPSLILEFFKTHRLIDVVSSLTVYLKIVVSTSSGQVSKTSKAFLLGLKSKLGLVKTNLSIWRFVRVLRYLRFLQLLSPLSWAVACAAWTAVLLNLKYCTFPRSAENHTEYVHVRYQKFEKSLKF